MKDKPFSEKIFDDSNSIGLFINAINSAEKMNGILDYGAIFLMKLTLKDGNYMEYHLNIVNTENPQNGLLLKLPDTAQSFAIPEKISNDLKEIIYNSSESY